MARRSGGERLPLALTARLYPQQVMFRRPVSVGLLAAMVACAPAAGHGRSHLFPSLKATAGAKPRAQRVERRVRAIETSLLGTGHAAEHARQRALRHRLGARARAAATPLEVDNSFAGPQVGGWWDPAAVDLPIVAINATLLRTGRILIFAYPWRPGRPDPDNPGQTLGDSGEANAYVFDPATGTSRRVDPPINADTGKPAVIFCAGTSTLADGRVLVTGGDVGDPTASPNRGLNTIYLFDPGTETWQTGPRMRQGRWYPTQLELPDGRTVIMAGRPDVNDPDVVNGNKANTDVEIFSPDGSLQRLKKFKIDGAPGHPELIGQYPHMWWMPAGHALIAGPRKSDSWLFDPDIEGGEEAGWTPLNNLPGIHRDWAAGALLPIAVGSPPKAMLFGGADRDDRSTGGAGQVDPAVASTIVFDDETGKWSNGPAMSTTRAFANSVLLPDGKIAVVGGGLGDDGNKELYRWQYAEAQKRIDIFDPAAGAFTFGNAQAEARTYHSTALLLPDGRVMSAGDDINGPTGPDSGVKTDTAELWSPPYLFNADGSPAARPTLTSVPEAVNYGKPFVAGTPDDITSAVLVAPGADTHANDMSQRLVRLAPPQKVNGGVNLVAPGSANLAPPGYYMLFLLNAQGTPSTAGFIAIGSDAPVAVPTPTPEPTVTVTPSPTPDPVRFAIKLKVTKTTLRRLRRTRGLTVNVAPNRAATVRLALSLGTHRLAPVRRMRFAGGFGRITQLRLSRAGARRLAGRKRATLRLRASGTPTSGAPRTVTRRIRLTR
ncbi:MAG: hypothetical protein QOI80_1997 [Solirubrobacteraceae bacterium]|nr:hypothetical protein [Solirubrobacteraceae bacterium]